MLITRQLLVASLLTTLGLNAQDLNTPARPPQYVVFAFDGSKTINFWKDSREFTKGMREQNIEVPFTYFLSGVVFLKDTQKRLYKGPKHTAGQSDISFGGNETELTH